MSGEKPDDIIQDFLSVHCSNHVDTHRVPRPYRSKYKGEWISHFHYLTLLSPRRLQWMMCIESRTNSICPLGFSLALVFVAWS